MRIAIAVLSGALLSGVFSGCTALSPHVIGDPTKHGFVLIEGDAVVSNIGSVTVESVEFPIQAIRGQHRRGRTWFSNLAPGTYRVRELGGEVDFNGNSLDVPEDVDPLPLTFTVDAGQLVYLGNILLASYSNSIANVRNPKSAILVHGGQEFAAWESVYDLYAHTQWEPLILMRLEATK